MYLLTRSAFLSLLFIAACQSSGSPDPDDSQPNSEGLSLSVTLKRDKSQAPNPVEIIAVLKDEAGKKISNASVQMSASSGTLSEVSESSQGSYTARLVPAEASGEIEIEIQAEFEELSTSEVRTALILPHVHSDWGQPEAVRGLVNTAGYEDGVEVSPDGKWLIVSNYSPIDIVCCLLGCNGENHEPLSPSCQTVRGPYSGEARPDFPGAERILSSNRIVNRCPRLCYTDDFTASGGEITETFFLPPVSAYLFKRDSDGKFIDPRSVAFEANGCASVMGLSFLSSPSASDDSTTMLFSFTIPNENDVLVYSAPVQLNETTRFGNYTCGGAGYTLSDSIFSPITLNPNTGKNGNPNAQTDSFIWFDDEYRDPAPDILRFAALSGALPAGTPGATQDVAIGVGEEQKQPFFHSTTQTLYFTRNSLQIQAYPLTGSDPSNSEHWGGGSVILEAESGSPVRDGSVRSIGEPSIAMPDESTLELYFVYAVWKGDHYDLNVGVVRK